MRSASGSKASRVCMGLLMDRAEPLSGGANGFLNSRGSCAAGGVMDCKDVLQGNEFEKILSKMRIEFLQVCQLQVLQFAVPVECQAHSFADDFVRNAEWHALADKIGRRGEGIHVTGFR